KKAGRIAAEGLVDSYIHMGGKIGVLLEVNCETDFVAKTDAFKSLVHDIAMHIAAAKPEFLDRADVPTDNLEKEKEILRAQALNEGKPEKIVERMVEGRIDKYYKEVCLMEQAFVKDPDKSIKDLISDATVAIGEKISIRRFTRYERGEGIEKRKDNFAEEIAEQKRKAGL
ncbi:MAG: translation elongation factor Ts, partial [Oscillospiraceae bacterium]|nr:translation elongation factor Ts [Oscillospiraceae bacterium]